MATDQAHVPAELDPGQRAVPAPFADGRDRDVHELGDLEQDEVVLHRLVRDDPPDLAAFVSKLVRGGRRFPAERPILHAGMSMFATVDQAVSRARRIPKIVAAVRLSGPDIPVAKTLGAGQYTVWGEAEDLCERASIVHHESWLSDR